MYSLVHTMFLKLSAVSKEWAWYFFLDAQRVFQSICARNEKADKLIASMFDCLICPHIFWQKLNSLQEFGQIWLWADIDEIDEKLWRLDSRARHIGRCTLSMNCGDRVLTNYLRRTGDILWHQLRNNWTIRRHEGFSYYSRRCGYRKISKVVWSVLLVSHIWFDMS